MSIVLQGSTSGSCTLQEQAVAGTTVLTLPAVTGTILTTTSPKAGNVLQVVQATYSTSTSNSTNVFADTGLSASITPSSSSSKILVLVTQNGLNKSGSNVASGVTVKLLRGSTDILTNAIYAVGYTNSTLEQIDNCSFSYLDSPATTSSTTYKTQFANNANAASVTVQLGSSPSSITLLEIAA
jgi:hypothetical protein